MFERQPALRAGPSVEAERLDAIGGVAAGVAHHLNNILMVVLGNIQLTLMHGVDEEPARRLQTAEHAARDAAEVLRSLSAFCRTQPMPAMEPVDLNVVVDEVVDITSPRWHDEPLARGTPIVVRVDRGELVPVRGSAPALRQVLINLIANAVEAMPDGGTLSVRTWIDDGGVHCLVSDTGVGMTLEMRRRALEPFQTTKGPRTRGLGLAVAHGIINRHRGRLAIDSLEGRGTSVLVSLPAAGARTRG